MLTLRPRAARPVSLPRIGRAGNALDEGKAGAGSPPSERPPLWIVLPAVLVALFALLPLLYLVARALGAGGDGWRFFLRSRALEVGLNTAGDRESTRLNSSHANISFAVFCFEK